MTVIAKDLSSSELVPAYTMLMFRSGVSGVILLIYCLCVYNHKSFLTFFKTNILHWHIFRSLSAILGIISWFIALQYPSLSIAKALVITLTGPLLAKVIAPFLINEKVSYIAWITSSIALVGSLIVMGYDINERELISNLGVADFLVIFSTFCWALSCVIKRKLVLHDKNETIVLYLATLLFLNSIPLVAIYHEGSVFSLWSNYLQLLKLVSLGSISLLSYLFMLSAYRYLDLGKVIVFDYVRVAVAAILAFIFLGEELEFNVIIGAIIILLSSIMNVVFNSLKEKNTQTALYKKLLSIE